MPFRILLFLLLTATNLHAQDAPRPVRDSAYAVHNLFRQRRNNGLGAAGYGFAGLTGTVLAATRGQGSIASLLTLNTLISTVVAVRQFNRYSERKEASVVQRYEQGWPLPTGIRRRLKAKYFRPMN